MKEVENNKDLNSVLEKIKADCKRDVKLAADQYVRSIRMRYSE